MSCITPEDIIKSNATPVVYEEPLGVFKYYWSAINLHSGEGKKMELVLCVSILHGNHNKLGLGGCLLSFWKVHDLLIRKLRPVLCPSLLFGTHVMSFNEILHIMAGKGAFLLKLHKVSPCTCSKQLTARVQQPQKLTQVWQIEVLKCGGNKTETPDVGSDNLALCHSLQEA